MAGSKRLSIYHLQIRHLHLQEMRYLRMLLEVLHIYGLSCNVYKNAIDNLLEYYKNNPDSRDIVHGPLIYDDLKSPSTHFKPTDGVETCTVNGLQTAKI